MLRKARLVSVLLGVAGLSGFTEHSTADPAKPLSSDLPAGQWVRMDKADVPGRSDVPLVYDPVQKRFLVLGGQPMGTGDLPYVDGRFDPAAGRWENLFPKGKDWGSKFGPCKPPAFKRRQPFTDVEGNARLDFTYGFAVFFSYRNYGYAPEQERFIFYSAGYTFAYDPAERTWKDLAPADHPLRAAGTPPGSYYGPLLHWGSMCWAENIRRFVLFGGANVPTGRGDPGTWTYDPAANKWEQVAPGTQPAQRANSQLAYDQVNRKVVLFGGDGLNALYADTWVFDGKQWAQVKPPVSPSPRAGHALFWHAKSSKIVLLGGYGYGSNFSYGFNGLRDLPLEMW
jgi:hypothetical protein